MQYQSECLSALKSVANIQKPFEKTFMDTMKLFMAIPDRINFLQLGRYGCFSEQTYRNLPLYDNAFASNTKNNKEFGISLYVPMFK